MSSPNDSSVKSKILLNCCRHVNTKTSDNRNLRRKVILIKAFGDSDGGGCDGGAEELMFHCYKFRPVSGDCL